MSAATLLQHLEKVKSTKSGHWLACCPAHDDKSPSLSICEKPDGRVLVKCWSGCSVEEILSSVGLTFEALYPEKEIHHGKPERRPFPAPDMFRALIPEMYVNYLCAQATAKGEVLPKVDMERLLLAINRFQAALHAGGI